MNEDKVIIILKSIKEDLDKGFRMYSSSSKDTWIKAGISKVDVLIELLRK